VVRLRDRVWPLLRATRVPQVLEWLLQQETQSRCHQRVTAAEGVVFGATAIVHSTAAGRARIEIGAHTHVDGELLVHDYGGEIRIGSYSYVGAGARVWSGERVAIGDHVFIAHNVNIADTNAHQFDATERAEHYRRTVVGKMPFEKGTIRTAAVTIGNHAWINFNVAVLKGVTIGEGAIVGACSVVTEDVPPYVLVAGNPARVVRQLDRAEVQARDGSKSSKPST